GQSVVKSSRAPGWLAAGFVVLLVGSLTPVAMTQSKSADARQGVRGGVEYGIRDGAPSGVRGGVAGGVRESAAGGVVTDRADVQADAADRNPDAVPAEPQITEEQ